MLLALAVLIHTLDGATLDALQQPAGSKAVVYIFTSVDCPISNRYAPEIQRIERTFAPQGVVFRLVYPGKADADAAIREHVKAFAYEGPVSSIQPMRDKDFALVKHTRATITPEAVVLVNSVVAYQGRIDDRYVELGVERPAPTSHDLADALAAIVAGRPVAHARTQAVGCFIADLMR